MLYLWLTKLEKKLNLDDGQHQPKSLQCLYLVMELAEKTLAQYLQVQENRVLSEADHEMW